MESTNRNASTLTGPRPDAIADAVVCLRCEAPARGDRKFCGDCGAPLWFDCEGCGQSHPAGEKFCGGCGADIAGRIAALRDKLQGQLDAAREAVEKYRFDEAEKLLGMLVRHRDLRVASIVEEATTLSAEATEMRRHAETAAECRLVAAREHLSAGRLAETRAEMEFVPKPLLTDEMRTLFDRVTSEDNEVDELKREIKEALAAKNFVELLPKLERMLQLRPDDPKYGPFFGQVCDKVFDLAGKRFAAHQYAGARDFLRALPASFVESNEACAKLIRRNDELLFLERRLARALWTTPAVEAMAAAFVQRAPEYEGAAAVAKRLAARQGKRPADERRLYVDWRKVSDDEAPLPTQEHVFSRRIVLADDLSAEAKRLWKSEPGRFFAAIGVGLQTLGKSVVTTNLDPEERTSLLGSLSLFREKVRGAWGLDGSATSLKAARLSIREDGVVLLHDLFLHDSPIVADDDDAVGVGGAREAIKAFHAERLADKRNVEGMRFGACLPSDGLIERWFRMPVSDEKTLDKMVAFEAKTQIPFPLEELRWDWQRLDAGPAASGKSRDDAYEPASLMIVAARKNWLASWQSVFKESEIKLHLVQSDALALAAYAHYEWNLTDLPATEFVKKGFQPAPPDPSLSLGLNVDDAIAIVDVGARHSSVVIVGDRLAWFRSFGVGSLRLNRRIAAAYRLTVGQAEALKRDPAQAKLFASFYEAVQPTIVDFREEYVRSLRLFRTAFPDKTIKRLFVTGGGARFDEFPASLALGPDRFFERQVSS